MCRQSSFVQSSTDDSDSDVIKVDDVAPYSGGGQRERRQWAVSRMEVRRKDGDSPAVYLR